MRFITLPVTIAVIGFATGALAQGGPVATNCANDIAKLCARKPHDWKRPDVLGDQVRQLVGRVQESFRFNGRRSR